jgi:hypothetical protein
MSLDDICKLISTKLNERLPALFAHQDSPMSDLIVHFYNLTLLRINNIDNYPLIRVNFDYNGNYTYFIININDLQNNIRNSNFEWLVIFISEHYPWTTTPSGRPNGQFVLWNVISKLTNIVENIKEGTSKVPITTE